VSEDPRELARLARAAKEARWAELGISPDLWRHIDADGVLTEWPARKQNVAREAALDYLAELFDGEPVNERTVNDRLKTRHSFNDSALLRRELVDSGRLERAPDGTWYVRKTP
jgi:hypothetical protein